MTSEKDKKKSLNYAESFFEDFDDNENLDVNNYQAKPWEDSGDFFEGDIHDTLSGTKQHVKNVNKDIKKFDRDYYSDEAFNQDGNPGKNLDEYPAEYADEYPGKNFDEYTDEYADEYSGRQQPSNKSQSKKTGNGQPNRPQSTDNNDLQYGTASRKKNRQKKKLRNRILIPIVVILILAAIGAAVYYLGFVFPNNNYDGQMRLGVKYYKAAEFEKAEIAFKRALEYKPNDPEATVALTDTYIKVKRFDEAVTLMVAMQALLPEDDRTYNRLITLYATHLSDIPSANEQILYCINNGIDPKNNLIKDAPVIDPKGGIFGEPIVIKMSAPEGSIIYYTNDGTVPNEESYQFTEDYPLNNNVDMIINAIAVDETGLMSWMASEQYTIDIKLMTNNQAIELIGSSAETIMNAQGPLFYSRSDDRGYFYNNSDEDVYFIFAKSNFDSEEAEVEVDETVSPEAIAPKKTPENTPLPDNATAIGVQMKISEYILQMPETMSVEEFVSGLNIEDYDVSKSRLTFTKDGIKYDFNLIDNETVGRTKSMTAMKS